MGTQGGGGEGKRFREGGSHKKNEGRGSREICQSGIGNNKGWLLKKRNPNKEE